MAGVDWQAVLLSVRLAAVVCVTLLAIALPLAYWLTFSRRRWKFLVETVVALPLVLPPTVLGFYVLVAIGARSPIGQTWMSWSGGGLAFSFEGLVVASILYSLPFAVQPVASSFSQVDRTLLEASAILGSSRLRTFRRVLVPLSRNGILTGAILSFAHTIGEFGVVLMIGGNIPGKTKVIAIALYDYVERLQWGEAHVMAAGMVVFAFLVIALTLALDRRLNVPLP